MKSVSIKSLGLTVFHSEATYAQRYSRPNERCNAMALNLFLTWILTDNAKSQKVHVFFSSDWRSCVWLPFCTWNDLTRDDNHVFILICVSICLAILTHAKAAAVHVQWRSEEQKNIKISLSPLFLYLFSYFFVFSDHSWCSCPRLRQSCKEMCRLIISYQILTDQF